MNTNSPIPKKRSMHMILIEIDEKIGTYTQKKPIIQLFDPYLSLK